MEALRFVVWIIVVILTVASAHSWEKRSGNKKVSWLQSKKVIGKPVTSFSQTLLAFNGQTEDDRQYSYKRTMGNDVSGGSLADRIRHTLPYIAQANSISVGILFALLIWRLLSVYELADSKGNQVSAILAKYCTLAMLSTNVFAFLAAVFRPVVLKNYLKVILAVNIAREWFEAAHNIIMILTASSALRDMHFGRLLMNCWWAYLCFSFSKSRWVAQIQQTRFGQEFGQQS